MPEVLKYDEAMGSPEAHLAVMKNRAENAKADYERALEKNISPAAIQTAKELWEQRQEEYDDFMGGNINHDKDSEEKTSAAVH